MRCKVDGMLLACSAERRKAQEEREGRVRVRLRAGAETRAGAIRRRLTREPARS